MCGALEGTINAIEEMLKEYKDKKESLDFDLLLKFITDQKAYVKKLEEKGAKT